MLLFVASAAILYFVGNQGSAVSTLELIDSPFVKDKHLSKTPSFKLVSQGGQDVSQDQLLGRWSLVFFGFTSCPHVCPDSLGRLKKVGQYLQEEYSGPFQILFVSIDPETDAPSRLNSYMKSFDGYIMGLTGQKSQIDRLADFFSAQGPDLDSHATAVFVVDPTGRSLGHFPRVLSPKVMHDHLKKFANHAQ